MMKRWNTWVWLSLCLPWALVSSPVLSQANPIVVLRSELHTSLDNGNFIFPVKVKSGLKQSSEDENAVKNMRWYGFSAVKDNKNQVLVFVVGSVGLALAVLFLRNFQLRRRIKRAINELQSQQEQLTLSEKTLHATNRNLEERVRKRTQELSTSNQKLRFQIDEHNRTTNQLAKVNTYLSALQDTMMGLMRRLDLEELLEAIIDHATRATGAEHGYVYLVDSTPDCLTLRVGRGLFEKAIGLKLKAGEGLAGKVLTTGQLITIKSYHNWGGRYLDSHWDSLGAIVGIPLTSDSEVIGVIGLAHSKNQGQFERDEILFLNGFAELASIALDNAYLYSDLQRELKQREKNEKERIQLEEKFRQAQKMEAIGTLAGGIAHDFNNILSSILGFTELSMEKLKNDETIHQYLSNVYQSGLRAKDLVQQILTFGRKSTQTTQNLYLAPVIKKGIELIRSSLPSSVEICQHINEDHIMVNANPVQIHQVLMNLCVNASYVMEEHGGTLNIYLERAILDDEMQAINPEMEPGEYAQLTIQDNGDGMSSDVLERIFEPYFTTKEMERGTGLGLSVVHGIVKHHGGYIKVYSEVGVGTTFMIFLPAYKESLPVKEFEEKIIVGGPEHILIVDDEPILVSANQKMLEQLGYRVTACNDGQSALDLFTQHPDKYDLVLTDMTMPKMTGDKLTKALLKINPHLPIIIYTGFSHHISLEKVKKIGARALLMKPLESSDLALAIRKELDGN